MAQMTQKVHEVMTMSPVSVGSQTTLVDVANLMRERDIGDVLVIDNGRFQGILTDRDIVVRAVAENRDLRAATAEDVCSRDIVDVSPNDDADRAVMLMRARAVRRVPVMEGDRVVGILALSDMAVERQPESALADISVAEPNT
jgi:CBS domain-containing protein